MLAAKIANIHNGGRTQCRRCNAEAEIIRARLKKNGEKSSRAEAERWEKCCTCKNLTEFIFKGVKCNKYVFTSVIDIFSMLRLSKLGQEYAKLVLMGCEVFSSFFFILKNQLVHPIRLG